MVAGGIGVTCLCLFAVVVGHMVATAPTSAVALAITLAVSFVIEIAYRRRTGRTLNELLA